MSDTEDRNPAEGDDQDLLKVLKHQAQTLQSLDVRAEQLQENTAAAIEQSEALLEKMGRRPAQANIPRGETQPKHPPPPLRSWDEIVAEAEQMVEEPALITNTLTPAEIDRVAQRLAMRREEFAALHRLDKLDWTICGVTGILAALVDIFLIQMPKHPGFLGSQAAEGGPLANWIRERVNNKFSPADIERLEQENWVPYDAAHSGGLKEPVAGLGPGTHRFQSLGHDPLLGFIIGVKDILQGTFTAIDDKGRLIVQAADLKEPAMPGMNLFQAMGRVYGHLASDIATPRGLPAPLMPLLQFLQVGQFGRQGYTIGELSRIMYRSGYDFRHFLAMSISPLLIEILLRLSYFAKRMIEGHSLEEAIPLNLPEKRQPKLQTMLFSAHVIATAANAGKVTIGQNPLLINYPQWLAFFRYALPQLKWMLLDREEEQVRYVQTDLDQAWDQLDQDLKETWRLVFETPIVLA